MKIPEQKCWNPPPTGIKEKQVDHMPKEVATEMLLRQTSMDSSKNRRAYMAARCRVFESDRVKQQPSTVLEKRLKHASWAQLVKWERRSILHRQSVQDAHKIATRQLEKAQAVEAPAKPTEEQKRAMVINATRIVTLQRALALLDLKAAQLDVFWDAVDTEKGRRSLLIENLRKLKLTDMAASLESATKNN